MERSEALDQAIRDRCERLNRFHPGITSVHVAVTQETRHSQKGRLFNVKLDVHAGDPGMEAVQSLATIADRLVERLGPFHAMECQLDRK
jgi:ribosome-associated translation inhibitor RaiA